MHGAVSELVRDVSLLNFKKTNLCHRCFIIQVKNGGRHSPTQICRYLRSLLLASLRCNIHYTGIPTNLMKKKVSKSHKISFSLHQQWTNNYPEGNPVLALSEEVEHLSKNHGVEKKNKNQKQKNKKNEPRNKL